MHLKLGKEASVLPHIAASQMLDVCLPVCVCVGGEGPKPQSLRSGDNVGVPIKYVAK